MSVGIYATLNSIDVIFLSASQFTQRPNSTTLFLVGHGGGENGRGHPQGRLGG